MARREYDDVGKNAVEKPLEETTTEKKLTKCSNSLVTLRIGADACSVFCVRFFCSPHTVAQLHTHSECTRAVVQLSSVSACTSFCSHPLMKWIAPNIYHSVDTLPHIRHSFMYYVNTAVGWLAGSCCLCNSLLTGISFVSEVRKFITEFFFLVFGFWPMAEV